MDCCSLTLYLLLLRLVSVVVLGFASPAVDSTLVLHAVGFALLPAVGFALLPAALLFLPAVGFALLPAVGFALLGSFHHFSPSRR